MDFSDAMRKLRADEGTAPGEIEIIAGNLLDLTRTTGPVEQYARSIRPGGYAVYMNEAGAASMCNVSGEPHRRAY